MHCQVYSSLWRSPCFVMAIARGKSFSISVISCSTSRLARSDVSTGCVSPSRHQMHSQYEPCSFKPFMFCVSRSNCFKSVIFTFSLSISITTTSQKQSQPSATTANLVVVRQYFLGRRSTPIEMWPLVRAIKNIQVTSVLDVILHLL